MIQMVQHRPTKARNRGTSAIRNRNISTAASREIARLKTLIKPRQQNPLQNYWELGNKASVILNQSAEQQDRKLPIGQLAERIGLRRTTLQESIKFAERITSKRKVIALQAHGFAPFRRPSERGKAKVHRLNFLG